MRAGIRARLSALSAAWRARLADDHVVQIDALAAISETALTREVAIEVAETGLPTTFVPGRNLVFLAFAGAVAYRRGIKHLVAGMCETDYSGYPDCRDDTIKAMQLALTLGMDRRFVIHTPLMWIDKAATFALAHEIGGDPLIESAARSDPHVLSRRPPAPPCVGFRLRRMPGLPVARRRLCQVEGRVMSAARRQQYGYR